MSTTREFISGGAPGIDAPVLNEPFHVANVTYDSGNNRLVVTIGAGRADFLGVVVEKNDNSTYYVASPGTSTTYYIYLKSDGTFTHGTTGVQIAGAVRLGYVQTGTTLEQLTREDLRGCLPGAAARTVQDNLNARLHATTGHKHDGTTDNAPKIPDGSLASGVATAATPNTLVKRDAAGRAKVAAPATADDIARKDTVDAVMTRFVMEY